MKFIFALLICTFTSALFAQGPRAIPPAKQIEKPFSHIENNQFRYGYGYPGYNLYIDSYGYQFRGYGQAYGNTHRYQYRNRGR